MMRVHSPYLWPRIALIAVSVLLHMPSTAYDMTQGEVYVRVFLFYTFCFVHYHVFSARVPYDNHTHTLLGPNVNLYILFVHPHVVLLALVGTCCVVCTMHFEDCRLHKREDCASAPAPKDAAPAPTPDREMQELMLELRAAQGSRV
jgi:hypothetical protein